MNAPADQTLTQSLCEAIVSVILNAVVVTDGQQRVLLFNPAAEKMFGIAAGAVIGKTIERLIPAWFRRQHARHLAALAGRRHPPQRPGRLLEMVGRRAGGEEFQFEASLSQIQVHGEQLSILVLHDITERKQFESALRQSQDTLELHVQERTAALRAANAALAESEARYRRLFQTVSDAIVVADLETRRITEVNDAAVRLFGYTREEFLKLEPYHLTAEVEKSRKAIRSLMAGKLGRVPLRYYKKRDGTIFPVEISGSTFTVKGRLVLCGLIRDISEQTELEREILAVSEREHRRLGQDLHDDLCQQLAGIEFLSQTLAGDLAKQANPATAQAREIARMVQCAMSQTRELARGLVPFSVQTHGLPTALQELAARTRRTFHLDCRFHGNTRAAKLEENTAVHLYRIAQEAVSNAVKHGKARRIDIGLAAKNHHLVLRVKDNGVGLPLRPPRRKGMGLRLMRHRAEVIGGSLVAKRAPQGGTLVLCTAPKTPPHGTELGTAPASSVL